VDGLAETGYSFGLALASHPFRLSRFRVEAPVAQWIEYCPPKAGVAGSIPAGRTTEYCLSRAYAIRAKPFFIAYGIRIPPPITTFSLVLYRTPHITSPKTSEPAHQQSWNT
jgi:hypothetical protein